MVTTKQKPRVDPQKTKQGKQSTPPREITNLEREAEMEGKSKNGNTK